MEQVNGTALLAGGFIGKAGKQGGFTTRLVFVQWCNLQPNHELDAERNP